MFVRWLVRPSGRITARLVEGRRANGKVKQEHIAQLGHAWVQPTIEQRREFWLAATVALGRLSNRLTPQQTGAIMTELHQRVPMVTPDELHTLTIFQAERDSQQWDRLAAMHADVAAGHDGLATTATKAAERGRQAAEVATRHADEARDRLARARAGETVAETREMTPERKCGWRWGGPGAKRGAIALSNLSPAEFEAHTGRHHSRRAPSCGRLESLTPAGSAREENNTRTLAGQTAGVASATL
jgi:hypothetical protein